MAHITDWMALGNPSPEWEAAVKQMPARPNLGAINDIRVLRAHMAKARAQTNTALELPSGITKKDVEIPTRDGSKIPAEVFAPEGKTGLPVVVLFHGGGYCIGGLENEFFLSTQTAGSLNAVAINVGYRLAPEHQFPTAHHDGIDAAKWAAANASSFGGDLSKGFIAVGSSAGANIAISTILTLRDEGKLPPFTGALLKVPPVCSVNAFPEKYMADYKSWDQNEHADILSRHACELFSDNYIPNHEDRKGELFSPLLWSTGLKNFPRSYFQICGADPLRDEALIFERILRTDEGVATKVEVYPGLPHGFGGVVPALPSSKKFNNDSVDGLRWLLTKQ